MFAASYVRLCEPASRGEPTERGGAAHQSASQSHELTASRRVAVAVSLQQIAVAFTPNTRQTSETSDQVSVPARARASFSFGSLCSLFIHLPQTTHPVLPLRLANFVIRHQPESLFVHASPETRQLSVYSRHLVNILVSVYHI